MGDYGVLKERGREGVYVGRSGLGKALLEAGGQIVEGRGDGGNWKLCSQAFPNTCFVDPPAVSSTSAQEIPAVKVSPI